MTRTREIRITIIDGVIEVWEHGKTTRQLSWDEMLGQIAELTHPALGAAHYPMKTLEEWQEWQDKYAPPLGAQAEKPKENHNVNPGVSQGT